MGVSVLRNSVGVIWTNVLLMDEVLPDVALSDFSLEDFCQLLDNDLGILVKLRELIIDWVQEGFQDFFRKLDDRFLLLPGKTNLTSQDRGTGDQLESKLG
ncbi:hypothetical protein LOK49_LG07G01137 [Camellia lanceoleosa]|uniref:Uncharacterized protein n=1 Tax=Camellia lanceoleosa TaxID=1840588 RepID=A0ACC0H3A2_9ERIC|nr:hypothetical protein LOK49_LG07G01137 [Camellia lanceoleosa]